jgi:hypothetical protein
MRNGLLVFCFAMAASLPASAQQHGRTPRFGDFGTVNAAQALPNTTQPK